MVTAMSREKSPSVCYEILGELRLSENHSVTEYEMSGEPYSQKRADG